MFSWPESSPQCAIPRRILEKVNHLKSHLLQIFTSGAWASATAREPTDLCMPARANDSQPHPHTPVTTSVLLKVPGVGPSGAKRGQNALEGAGQCTFGSTHHGVFLDFEGFRPEYPGKWAGGIDCKEKTLYLRKRNN